MSNISDDIKREGNKHLSIIFIIGLSIIILFSAITSKPPTSKQSDMPTVKRTAGMTEQQWEKDKQFKQELMKYYNK